MADASENSIEEYERNCIKFVRGLPFSNKPFFKTKNIEAAFDYRAQDGDIVLCSYPKTGTMWSKYIIYQILHKGQDFPLLYEMNSRVAPFLELSGLEPLGKLEKPVFFMHHLPYNSFPKNKNAKYLYVYRRPEDILVSFYHFTNGEIGREMTFDDFFEIFMNGRAFYGDYFDHLLSFYEHRHDDNIFMFSYEELHQDKRGVILRIAKFLGEEYYKSVTTDESLIQKIMEVTSFDYMKKNLNQGLPIQVGGEKKFVNFFRKGQVGEGRKVLSENQKKRLKARMREKLTGTEFVKLWS